QYEDAPGFILTSMVKVVDTAVFEAIRATQQGTLVGGVQHLGLKEDGVKWVYDEHNKALIPDAVKARVDSLAAEIIAGRLVVPSTTD
ncbi:MAG: BMP family ABC transporter substrate-binding protein, partial [Candidatus Eisenbacteria bacterium]|nr:BMP family ABC transporter substrate-binding protein [Candidatus Eisenbacteria bacterium]